MGKFRSGGNPDRNQAEIVKDLRKAGFTVLIVSEVANCFDILVGAYGFDIPMEIKATKKDKLREGERKFKEKTQGGYFIIHDTAEALEAIHVYWKMRQVVDKYLNVITNA